MQCAVLGPFCPGAAQLEIERENSKFSPQKLVEKIETPLSPLTTKKVLPIDWTP